MRFISQFLAVRLKNYCPTTEKIITPLVAMLELHRGQYKPIYILKRNHSLENFIFLLMGTEQKDTSKKNMNANLSQYLCNYNLI